MEGLDRSPWFAGDLADPWVRAIADVLPRAVRLACPGDLPETWPVEGGRPSSVVIHRSVLTASDAQRVLRLRSWWDVSPRLILCVGPHARYTDVERWSRLVDVVIPEATAAETIARHVVDRVRPSVNRPRVAVVSSNHEIRVTLADACRAAGYPAEPIAEGAEIPAGIPVAWDVPVLTPDWPARLNRMTRTSAVIALMGFADRGTVATARKHGAWTCLELPCEIDNLVDAFDRLTGSRHLIELGHSVPPVPFLEPGTGRRSNRQGAKTPRSEKGSAIQNQTDFD